MGLNPFEFRAGLEQWVWNNYARFKEVLIPLNSGLAWSRCRIEEDPLSVS